MPLTQITTGGLANGAVTTSKISNTVQLGGPTITQVQITDSSYNVLDDTAVSTSGGYIKITGTGFAAGAIVVIGSTNATSTAFVSSTVLNVQVPAQVAGTYTIYVVNSNGGTAIGVNGLTYSGTPTWVTGSTLPNGVTATPISIQLSATGDAPLTYALAAGNTLPTGLTLTSGGLLSGTVTVGVQTVYAFTINAIDAQLQDSPRAFTITISVGDPYFYLTTLLLPGNGTNNGTNNTFVDGSTNNFAITRAGNTTQGTFSPFSLTGWSNYFDGTGDYLSGIGAGDSFNFMHNTTALFTFECWLYKTTQNSGTAFIFCNNGGASLSIGISLSFENDVPYLFITRGVGGSPVCSLSGVGSFPMNTWTHLAITYDQSLSSNNAKIYINGTLNAQGSKTGNAPSNSNATNSLSIAGISGNYFYAGYLSNFRITNTIVYSSNFTPPTSALTAISGTSLLTCQSNRFKDNSTNNFAITRNGDTSVQSFSPFAPSAAYSTSTVGGSAYFDGTGDYLQNTSITTQLDANAPFTIDLWVYPTSYPESGWFNTSGSTVNWNTSTGLYWTLYQNANTLYWQTGLGNGLATTLISFAVPPSNQWSHIAIGFNGTTTRIWLNGVSVGTSNTAYFKPSSADRVQLGAFTGGANPYAGYISNARFVKSDFYGVANSTITVPTAPFTAIANTTFLLNFTNGQITDATSKTELETIGDSKISTTQSKWGGSSMYFDGTGDCLQSPAIETLRFGNADFTIECWVYLVTLDGNTTIMRTDSGNGSNGILFCHQGLVYATSNGSSWDIINGSPFTGLTTGVWTHLALTRSGSTFKGFVNGSTTFTVTSSASIYQASPVVRIGAANSGGAIAMNGYVNDLRITRGYARYTANFTPPTSAFPTL